jgi:hypothetical protein
MSTRTCKKCGLPIDLCNCEEIEIENKRTKLLKREKANTKETVIGLIDKRIAELQPIWKKHIKDEGGSCYCMSSDKSCIPEAIEELRKLKKEIKKLE